MRDLVKRGVVSHFKHFATIHNGIGLLKTNAHPAGSLRRVTWRILTLVTCPCCIPLWVALFSGTAAGALLTRNVALTIGVFAVLFLFCAWKALHTYERD